MLRSVSNILANKLPFAVDTSLNYIESIMQLICNFNVSLMTESYSPNCAQPAHTA